MMLDTDTCETRDDLFFFDIDGYFHWNDISNCIYPLDYLLRTSIGCETNDYRMSENEWSTNAVGNNDLKMSLYFAGAYRYFSRMNSDVYVSETAEAGWLFHDADPPSNCTCNIILLIYLFVYINC